MILSRQDLSDPQNVRSCVAEFQRAQFDDFLMQSWASNWGDAICAQLQFGEDDESDAIADLRKEISELRAEHKAHLGEIQDAHVEAVDAIRELGKAIEQ